MRRSGPSTRCSQIGSLDHRDEEHGIGLFFLLSILFFVRWLRAKELDRRTGGSWNYALTLLFAALAMASKSSAVILPVVLCLCAWWMERRWYWRNLARVAPIFLMSIAASALSIWTQGLQLVTVTDPQWVRTWPQRLATVGDAVWFYLGKLLWPHPLIYLYPRWQIDAGQWVSYLPLLAVIVILSIFWFKRELWFRAWFFAFAYLIGRLAARTGFGRQFYILVFPWSLIISSIWPAWDPLALAGAGLVRYSDIVIPKKTIAAIGPLCRIATDPRRWQSRQRTGVYEKPRDTLDPILLPRIRIAGVGRLLSSASFFYKKGQVDKALEHLRKCWWKSTQTIWKPTATFRSGSLTGRSDG